MMKINRYRVIGRSKTFHNFHCDATNEDGIGATTYFKGLVLNAETGLPVKRDSEGYILDGEVIEGYIFVNRKGDPYVRPAIDPRKAAEKALKEVSSSILKNIDSYSTLKVRNVEGVLRDEQGTTSRAELLAAASGEAIPKLEWQQNENKAGIDSPLMLGEVVQAVVAMAYRSGDVTVGVDDYGTPVGIASSIARYGSTDRLETAVRNAIACRTNRLIETEFEFRKLDDGKVILVIHVSRAKAPVILDGKYFVIRCGNETRCLRNQEILDYISEFSA